MSDEPNARKHHNGSCKWMKEFMKSAFSEWEE